MVKFYQPVLFFLLVSFSLIRPAGALTAKLKLHQIIFFFLLVSFSLIRPIGVLSAAVCVADDPCKNLNTAYEKVNCYTDAVNICSSQRESMAAQVSYLSNKIELSNARIEASKLKIVQLEEEINDISDKIDKLEGSLTRISGLLLDRIVATYKYADINIVNILLTSTKFSGFINRFKYIQIVQAHNRRLLFQLQNSKINFQDQKSLREQKKIDLDATRRQLEKEEVILTVQKKEKELFLATTKNSEDKYRQELAAAKKEAEGIQQAASILSSAGVARHVNRGEVIGIMGNTGFSTGAHLHFAVYNLNESDLNKFNFGAGYENPLGVLVSRSMPFEPNSCDDVSPTNRTTKNVGSGSWEWPMGSPTISQCYGHTPWSWRYQAGIHNGLDMWDDANTMVKAVESGNAYTYRGGQSAGNGVFIFHGNGKMTLYWHLQ